MAQVGLITIATAVYTPLSTSSHHFLEKVQIEWLTFTNLDVKLGAKFENWRLQLQLGCKLHRYLLQKAWHNIWGRWGFVPINFFLSKYCFLGKHPSYEIIFCQSVQYIEFYCFYDIFCFEITGLNNIIIFPPGLHKCLLTKLFSKSFCHYASTTDFSFKIYYIETVFLALW